MRLFWAMLGDALVLSEQSGRGSSVLRAEVDEW